MSKEFKITVAIILVIAAIGFIFMNLPSKQTISDEEMEKAFRGNKNILKKGTAQPAAAPVAPVADPAAPVAAPTDAAPVATGTAPAAPDSAATPSGSTGDPATGTDAAPPPSN